MEDLTAVDTYLRKGEYPSGIGKGEKANLRRRCRNNFKLEGGVLYYKKALSAKESEDQSEWKICVRSNEEKQKIMESCHAGVGGMYGWMHI